MTGTRTTTVAAAALIAAVLPAISGCGLSRHRRDPPYRGVPLTRHQARRPWPVAVALCLLLASCSSSAGGGSTPTTNPSVTHPPAVPTATATPQGGARTCGRAAKPPGTWAHVVWIWMENHDYTHLVGNPQAPYENHTLIAGCGLATNYHNITHPSLPNYLAATSGDPQVHSDCQPSACTTTAPSLFAQLRTAGKTWRAYQESMPANCATHDTGAYAARHNPPVYYTPIAADCARWDQPMGSTASGNLIGDLHAGTLPDFAFITPNLCNDTHDCSVKTGDDWLADWIPRITASPAYQTGGTVVLLTWDEGDGGGTRDCARNTSTPGCHVATIVIAPTTRPGTRSDTLFNHYSLLKTTEQLLGLPATLGSAADPSTASMRPAFNL
jgi:phosphatidylinositol-3-phosphatase